jgi:hypothetical protein
LTWTVITITPDGEFSYSFSFVGSHSQRAAFAHAQEQTSFEVIAIVPGDHPVYAPSLDE